MSRANRPGGAGRVDSLAGGGGGRRRPDADRPGRAGKITCPTFVGNTETDTISASAPQLVDALTCEKEFVTVTAWEGAADHCECGARTALPRAVGWLDAILR
jgi:hypothetical protein